MLPPLSPGIPLATGWQPHASARERAINVQRHWTCGHNLLPQQLVRSYRAHCDQDHVRTLPSTTQPSPTAQRSAGAERPLSPRALIEGWAASGSLRLRSLLSPCNTAHSFFDGLQGRLASRRPHGARDCRRRIRCGLSAHRRAGQAAPVAADLYGRKAARLNVDCPPLPGCATQGQANRVIFDEVKAGRLVKPTALGRLAAPGRYGLLASCSVHRAIFGRRRDSGQQDFPW